MTHQQQKLLRFIERYIAEHDGVAPSFEEMRLGLGIAAKSGVHRLLASLDEQGKIRRARNRSRRIEIVGLPASLITLTDEALLAEVARRGLTANPAEIGHG